MGSQRSKLFREIFQQSVDCARCPQIHNGHANLFWALPPGGDPALGSTRPYTREASCHELNPFGRKKEICCASKERQPFDSTKTINATTIIRHLLASAGVLMLRIPETFEPMVKGSVSRADAFVCCASCTRRAVAKKCENESSQTPCEAVC